MRQETLAEGVTLYLGDCREIFPSLGRVDAVGRESHLGLLAQQECGEGVMGKGIEAARPHAPEHAAVLDDFKDQLLIAFLRRLGGKISMPVSEADDTGGLLFLMSVVDGVFNFELVKKQ